VLGAGNLKLETWNLKLENGAGNLKLETWNLKPGLEVAW
jgi:hypothetical protein